LKKSRTFGAATRNQWKGKNKEMSKKREGEKELRTNAESHPIAVRAIEVKPREYNLDIAR
jgi:hypothetical protein